MLKEISNKDVIVHKISINNKRSNNTMENDFELLNNIKKVYI
jgi:hypothetical protein